MQEAERKIESIKNVDIPQLGINEITSKVISIVIENEKKILVLIEQNLLMIQK